MNEIHKLIELSKIPQKEIAEKVGVSPARLSEYKKGKSSIGMDRLKKWCEILNINIKDLF